MRIFVRLGGYTCWREKEGYYPYIAVSREDHPSLVNRFPAWVSTFWDARGDINVPDPLTWVRMNARVGDAALYPYPGQKFLVPECMEASPDKETFRHQIERAYELPAVHILDANKLWQLEGVAVLAAGHRGPISADTDYPLRMAKEGQYLHPGDGRPLAKAEELRDSPCDCCPASLFVHNARQLSGYLDFFGYRSRLEAKLC